MKSTRTWVGMTVLALPLIAGTIDLNDLFDYQGQEAPTYITQDNTPANNHISNAGATLGRVLFYDKKLSINNTVACASCHQQEFAFSDPSIQSKGFDGGVTGRHSMRLVNGRYSEESAFFWDERASVLEFQTVMPIQDHIEMGFSGTNGQPSIDSLINKLNATDYYPKLVEEAFWGTELSEDRIAYALAQFVRSIQSFDSKFDEGLAQAGNINANFSNFTAQENQGKNLFIAPPPAGAGCQGCHRAPAFDIDPDAQNNGVITVAGDTGTDLTNTKSPSLRDVVNPDGDPNGPFMHDGSLTTLEEVIEHYNLIVFDANENPNLDQRLRGPTNTGQNLNLSDDQKAALVAFLKTLTGEAIYTAAQWSDPFDAQGNLSVLPLGRVDIAGSMEVQAFPNPCSDQLTLNLPAGNYAVSFRAVDGRLIRSMQQNGGQQVFWVNGLPAGLFLIDVLDQNTGQHKVIKVFKH